jgi:hypothetical protein
MGEAGGANGGGEGTRRTNDLLQNSQESKEDLCFNRSKADIRIVKRSTFFTQDNTNQLFLVKLKVR